MLVDAGSAECPPACSRGHFPALEVAEEFLPFLVAGDPVFISGAQRAPPGEECQVRLDSLFRIDGLVADRDIDVSVTDDNLRYMRRKAVHDGVRDKSLRKSWGV